MSRFIRNASGFTLMEILLATLILAMVVSMVTVALSGSLRVVEATREQGNLYYRAQVALQRISEDLESAVLIDGTDFIGNLDDGSDRKQILVRFVSMAHVDFDPDAVQGGMGLIRYALVADPDDGEQMLLLRSDLFVVPQEEKSDITFKNGFILCDRVKSVTFSYFNLEGEEQDSWDTRIDPEADEKEKVRKRRLPAAVSCRLEFWLDREEETTLTFQTKLIIPVGMVMARAGK
jgi:general secretion pathway protein J